MKAIEELMAEHDAVLAALGILDRITQALVERRSGAQEDLEAILDFFTGFVDGCHHAKEEEHLFPELERRGVRRDGGPIGVMLSEHVLGRKSIAGMKEGLARLRSGEVGAVDAIRRHQSAYGEMLSAHIGKENNVLFPMAERFIPAAVADGLADRFEEFELVKVGPGKHEAYHALLDSLASRYPAS